MRHIIIFYILLVVVFSSNSKHSFITTVPCSAHEWHMNGTQNLVTAEFLDNEFYWLVVAGQFLFLLFNISCLCNIKMCPILGK